MKIPVHIHKDMTLFVHPLPLTSDELARLSEHFRLFIQGVALGVLMPRRSHDSRELLYCLTKSGKMCSIGNERLIRMEGLHTDHLNLLESQVAELLERAVTLNHLAGLAVLWNYYAEHVYSPRIVRDGRGMETLQTGFAHVMCRKLADETRESLRMKSSGAEDELTVRLINTLDTWTDVIEGSETDVYEHEVDRAHVAKRRVKKEFFHIVWPEVHVCITPGQESEKSCMRCGEPTTWTSKFCPNCGSRFEVVPPPLLTCGEAIPTID